MDYLARRLGNAYDSFLKTAPTNSYAVMDEEGWRLSVDSGEKLDQEAQDRLANLFPVAPGSERGTGINVKVVRDAQIMTASNQS